MVSSDVKISGLKRRPVGHDTVHVEVHHPIQCSSKSTFHYYYEWSMFDCKRGTNIFFVAKNKFWLPRKKLVFIVFRCACLILFNMFS